MAGFGDVFGEGSTAEQFLIWGVLMQVLQPVMAPFLTDLGNLINDASNSVILSPNDAATSVARALDSEGDARDIASKGGVTGEAFVSMIKLAGNAPDMSTVMELFRRKLIAQGDPTGTDISLAGALADAGMRPQWIPLVSQLTTQLPTVAEVMNAWLEGQIEEPEANERYLAAGGDPTWFQTSYNANGSAPTPMELLTMLNRGVIPEGGTGPAATSYEQGFLEGPWRNKWEGAYLALREYYPPPRTITAMYHDGQLTQSQAAHYLSAQGLDDTLVQAYLSPATTTSTAKEKELAKSDIITLYTDQLIDKAKATAYLVALKYTAQDAALLLELADFKTTSAQVKAGVTRVRTLYEGSKLTATQAKAALKELDVPDAQAAQLVETWDITASHNTKNLTGAEIVDAWYLQLITGDAAMELLEGLGYDPFDAWVMLAVKNKGAPKSITRPASPYDAPA